MKKAGLLAIIMTCFTFAIALPATSAQHDAGALTANTAQMENTTNASMNNRNFNTTTPNGTGMMDRVENNVNNGMNRMENGVNRAMNRANNGMRAMDTDGYNGTNRANNLNNGRYRTNAATTNANANDRDFNWGWLGLLGLIGLAGMRSRDRDRA